MQYHKAAFLGQERARKAQMKLFNYTGFALLTYTMKQGKEGFEPVGDEDFAAKLIKGREGMLFICDRDGYAKAQSKALPLEKVQQIFEKMIADGLLEFTGSVKTVS